jgi:hypothetical protein
VDENEGIDASAVPDGPGCSDCSASKPSGWWLHLRRCAQCGHIGCCDSSPGRHARAHALAMGHRYVQSYEPGEDWFWDFATGRMFQGPSLAPPTSHPAEQPVPGPRGGVPADWETRLH